MAFGDTDYPHPTASDAASEGPIRIVPWQIWIVVAMLSMEAVGNAMMISRQPFALIWLAAKFLWIVGLIRGWKWVYVLFLLAAALHVVSFGFRAPLVALLNLIAIILVVSARLHFFPPKRTYSDITH